MSTATRASRRPSPGAPGAARHILVVVDSDGCAPPRPATPAEASAAASALAADAAWVPTDGPVRRTGGGSPPVRRPTLAPRPGGPCDHCGCRGECGFVCGAGPALAGSQTALTVCGGGGGDGEAHAAGGGAVAALELKGSAPRRARTGGFARRANPLCFPHPTSESPQWRRGPASKPVLCNACGTRYRRTNSLTPATAPAVAAVDVEAWARVEIEA